MSDSLRVFFRHAPSPGDENIYYLVRDPKTRLPAVLHQSSYRHGDGRRDREKRFTLEEFLSHPGPAQQALLVLIGTLADTSPAG